MGACLCSYPSHILKGCACAQLLKKTHHITLALRALIASGDSHGPMEAAAAIAQLSARQRHAYASELLQHPSRATVPPGHTERASRAGPRRRCTDQGRQRAAILPPRHLHRRAKSCSWLRSAGAREPPDRAISRDPNRHTPAPAYAWTFVGNKRTWAWATTDGGAQAPSGVQAPKPRRSLSCRALCA